MGLNDEHLTVRGSVGVFDVSHMGEFILKGENALISSSAAANETTLPLQRTKNTIILLTE